MTEPTIIELADLVIDPSLQPRIGGIDADHVQALQAVFESWPPLVVVEHDGRYTLIDGFHRLAAAQNLSLETVPVTIMPMPEDGDLHALAFSLNAAHGRPLALADRRAYAERLLRQHPAWADREIGRRCGLSSNTVGGLRDALQRTAQIEQSETRVGAGGYTYTVGTNPRQREPGELPSAPPSIGEAIGRLFTPAQRTQQRKIVQYLQRVAVALDDQYRLNGWETAEDAADACRLVLGPERAAALGEQLAGACKDILDVADILTDEPNKATP